MPTYDFKCSICKKRTNDVFQRMSEDSPKCCGKSMDVVPGRCSVYAFPQEGITLEHVESQPKTFYSKKEMLNYAQKNDLELGALL